MGREGPAHPIPTEHLRPVLVHDADDPRGLDPGFPVHFHWQPFPACISQLTFLTCPIPILHHPSQRQRSCNSVSLYSSMPFFITIKYSALGM